MALEGDDLRRHGPKVGLDHERFEWEMRMSTHEERVGEHLGSGSASGMRGTPTLCINGTRDDAPWDRSSLVAALARAAVAHPVP